MKKKTEKKKLPLIRSCGVKKRTAVPHAFLQLHLPIFVAISILFKKMYVNCFSLCSFFFSELNVEGNCVSVGKAKKFSYMKAVQLAFGNTLALEFAGGLKFAL